jgi:hypothetical protein
MFVCQVCGGVVAPRTPAIRVVTRRRPKQYSHRYAANPYVYFDVNGKRKVRRNDDPGGVGWEIDREVLACPPCAAGEA